jgi:hypothetical protein
MQVRWSEMVIDVLTEMNNENINFEYILDKITQDV